MAVRDPDVRLMLRVRDRDDQAAFAELVARFQHRLVGIMHHIVGNKEEAEDLAQEVFLRVFRTRAKYTPKAKFSTWLFTIANNLALNALRDRYRRLQLPLELRDSGSLAQRPHVPLAAHRDAPPTQNLQDRELADVVRRAMDDLNERQRVAVVLNKFEDMGYAEIAEVMGLTAKAVKSLLCRAREKLREALQAYIYMDREPPAAPVEE
ncbi:RNA polymerase sigma factor [Limnoglobus roseus]|uniref:RNA polymerase sigma factor n=1 Tax=Limnoglobus roseus TaxID=2598579 RepID=A0A5C1AJD8_9BACT|nr:sigma-70 family RNA polymerase sigma factor [Limnoglobus roseus]QEL18980.1 RNA polymerase subunit sigma-70 [Limnoglobus roseus]